MIMLCGLFVSMERLHAASIVVESASATCRGLIERLFSLAVSEEWEKFLELLKELPDEAGPAACDIVEQLLDERLQGEALRLLAGSNQPATRRAAANALNGPVSTAEIKREYFGLPFPVIYDRI